MKFFKKRKILFQHTFIDCMFSINILFEIFNLKRNNMKYSIDLQQPDWMKDENSIR